MTVLKRWMRSGRPHFRLSACTKRLIFWMAILVSMNSIAEPTMTVVDTDSPRLVSTVGEMLCDRALGLCTEQIGLMKPALQKQVERATKCEAALAMQEPHTPGWHWLIMGIAAGAVMGMVIR